MTAADDLVVLDETVAAVNALVRGLQVALVVNGESWPANVTRGANMLAARLYRRRNSPTGVEAVSDVGPVYVRRNDPDIATLLKLNRPAVG